MECKSCNREFSSRQRLQYHLQNKVCSKERRNSTRCEDCGKQFSSRQALQYHARKKVCQKTRERRCKECNHSFGSAQMLKYHVDNRVCLKDICERCEENKREEWHRHRCLGNYDLQEVVCWEHGDIAARCCPKETKRRLTQRKKEIDQRFAMFDRVEGVRWEDREYWEALCERCGCQRSDQHVWQCLYEGQRGFKEYVDRFDDWHANNQRDKKARKC
ncbi:zinc finger protein 58-like [Actinia tenebrosa]|uniref:Zinc finger protein 58-like n=1 Tax=Actinia tenebrosa TaxID=6105 RepID=A0A6P8HY74_ACTTE|nr:zinc finger protein 58-like [Actinia tenebrosa]